MTDVYTFLEGLKTEWKWDARCKVWSNMERQDFAICPRPVHHRIPNFQGAEVAATAFSKTSIFHSASSIAVGNERALSYVRARAITKGKTLYVPRLTQSDSYALKLQRRSKKDEVNVMDQVSFEGIRSATGIRMDEKFRVDIVVIGSVAVSKRGVHVGTGNGKSDLEIALLQSMGAIDEKTRIVAIVHDAQVIRVPRGLTAPHDVRVNMIVTPTRVIETSMASARKGIMWDRLSPWQLVRFKLLRTLKISAEREAGRKLVLGPIKARPPSPFYPYGRKHLWKKPKGRRAAKKDKTKHMRSWPFPKVVRTSTKKRKKKRQSKEAGQKLSAS